MYFCNIRINNLKHAVATKCHLAAWAGGYSVVELDAGAWSVARLQQSVTLHAQSSLAWPSQPLPYSSTSKSSTMGLE